MTEVVIKHRLFTWFEDGESPAVPGETVRMERISHFGDVVDIKDKASLERGKELDSFFSDEEAKQIKKGTYSGPHAALLEQFTGKTQRPEVPGAAQDIGDEGPQTDNLSSEEIGAYIHANKLNVDQTVALAREGDTESIEKIYDAEGIAAQLRGNDPRVGVNDRLDAMLAVAKESAD